MFHRYKTIALLLLGAALLAGSLQSCKTQRERRELSGVGKFYHNMTSHYNGYFNANELYEESKILLSQQHQDNYNQILPVFPWSAVDNTEAVQPKLDLAIEKLSTVIGLHRGSNWEDDSYLLIGQSQFLKKDYESAQKTLEYLSYEFDPSRDLYAAEYDREASRKERLEERKERQEELEAEREAREKERKEIEKERKKERKRLEKEREKERKRLEKERKKRRKAARKGKKIPSRETKKDREEEEKQEEEGKTSEIKPEAPDSEKKKSEKEESAEQEEKSDEPDPFDADALPNIKDVYPLTLLWLARTYTERDMFTRALQNFSELEKFRNLDKNVRRAIPPARAHFFITTDQYPDAARELEKAIEIEPKRTRRARYAFILAQIREKLGGFTDAMAYYKQAEKWTDDYELAFNARLKRSTAAIAAGGASSAEAIKELGKMLKDGKNKGFEDRIYYQMGQIYLGQGRIAEAEEMFLEALSFQSDNKATRAECYYALANIYLDRESYVKAKNYFDSTLMNMVANDIRYLDVKEWSADLTDIAKHLITIQEQDSLLGIASLDPEEKKKLAADLLAQRQEKEEAEEKSREREPIVGDRGPNYIPPKASTSSFESSFFAYNERALRKGYRDFRQSYGDRPLVDHWRRSAIIRGEIEQEIVDAEIEPEELSEQEMKDVFRNVPATDQAIEQSRQMVHDALFQLGVAFRENIRNFEQSTSAFARLVDEFPNSEKRAESYYYLYLNYQDIDNTSRANEYYNRLQEEYPESVFARVLKDPDYLASLSSEQRKLVNYYDQTYIAFQNDRHEQVLQRVSDAGEIYDDKSPYLPKMALLKAMSIGKLEGMEAYQEALRDMIARYPGTPEQVRAKEILRFLQGDQAAFARDDVPETFDFSKFRVDKDRLHYIIAVLYNQGDVGLNSAKTNITDFNEKFFQKDHLRVTNIYLDEAAQIPVIVIRKFDNAKEAMQYYDKVQEKSALFMPPTADYELFAVNQRNYREIIKSHTTAAYSRWFIDTYLKDR